MKPFNLRSERNAGFVLSARGLDFDKCGVSIQTRVAPNMDPIFVPLGFHGFFDYLNKTKPLTCHPKIEEFYLNEIDLRVKQLIDKSLKFQQEQCNKFLATYLMQLILFAPGWITANMAKGPKFSVDTFLFKIIEKYEKDPIFKMEPVQGIEMKEINNDIHFQDELISKKLADLAKSGDG